MKSHAHSRSERDAQKLRVRRIVGQMNAIERMLEENRDCAEVLMQLVSARKAIKSLAETSGLRVTASGGISGLDDLLKLQELEPLGVDSAVIGRALYENRFACQELWRLCEAGDYPYTAKV